MSIRALGRAFYFNPDCAVAYGTLPGGRSNEPETIRFLEFILSKDDSPWSMFIDVGASIGEMAIFAAGLLRVSRVLAIEPQQAACDAIRRSAAANGFSHVEVVEGAVSDTIGEAYLISPGSSPAAAHIAHQPVEGSNLMHTFTLDDLSQKSTTPAVLLIDVEGNELNVVKGGAYFISLAKPLIIFECNDTTRRVFELQEMRQQLGPNYDLFRLRGNGDGRLDRDFDHTWNLVAIPFGSVWESICQPLEISA
jgi:FkbM family methyltransferase